MEHARADSHCLLTSTLSPRTGRRVFENFSDQRPRGSSAPSEALQAAAAAAAESWRQQSGEQAAGRQQRARAAGPAAGIGSGACQLCLFAIRIWAVAAAPPPMPCRRQSRQTASPNSAAQSVVPAGAVAEPVQPPADDSSRDQQAAVLGELRTCKFPTGVAAAVGSHQAFVERLSTSMRCPCSAPALPVPLCVQPRWRRLPATRCWRSAGPC